MEALVFTRPGEVDLNIINGRVIVQDGTMLTVDIPVSVTSCCNFQAIRQASANMAEGLHNEHQSRYTCMLLQGLQQCLKNSCARCCVVLNREFPTIVYARNQMVIRADVG